MALSDARRPKLFDMKLTKKEKKELEPFPAMKYEGPDYPYGLRLHLDEDALEKLGISLPNVGETFEVSGIGVVMSVSENRHESQGRKHKSQSVEIQLQKLGLAKKG